MVIYVDVDDTLVRSVGNKIIVMPQAIEKIKSLSASGATLYCWSRGGEEYATGIIEQLGIRSCFAKVLSKPDVMIDDESWDELQKKIQMVHPSNLSNFEIAD